VKDLYDIHGLSVEVATDDEALRAALARRLRHFERRAPAATDIQVEYRAVPAGGSHEIPRPAGAGRPVYEPPAGEVLHFDEADRLFLDYEDRVRIVCDLGAGNSTASVRQEEMGNLWLLSRPMFTLPFLELAKRRGLYGLHAAAVGLDGHGILFPGASGAGKSTLAIALVRGGFDFLSDDLILIRADAAGVEALAFPEDIDATENTLRLFDDLAALLDDPAPAGWPKRRIAADEELGARVADRCRPRLLVFPRVVDSARSDLRPMDPSEALVELAPNVLLTDAEAAQTHLDALAQLVRQCPSFRLETGRDLDALPELLRSALAAA
jgi:hypothetical protein